HLLSILRWLFDVIDNQDSPWHFTRFEFQAQFFQGRVDGRSEGAVQLRVGSDRRLRVCVKKVKVVLTRNPCFVGDWRSKASTDIGLREHIECYSLGVDFHVWPVWSPQSGAPLRTRPRRPRKIRPLKKSDRQIEGKATALERL